MNKATHTTQKIRGKYLYASNKNKNLYIKATQLKEITKWWHL
jgi:hypothetical protein